MRWVWGFTQCADKELTSYAQVLNRQLIAQLDGDLLD